MSFDPYQRIAELEKALRQWDEVITKLLACIEELEARLNRNFKNSETPPPAKPPGTSKPA